MWPSNPAGADNFADNIRVAERLETIKTLLPATIGRLECDGPKIRKLNGVGQFDDLDTEPNHLDGIARSGPSVRSDFEEEPSISVVGLGHTGTVSLACLANRGFTMIGVDINEHTTMAVAEGKSHIAEDGVEELLNKAVHQGLISTTTNLVKAVGKTDVTFISVGTLPTEDGTHDLNNVYAASKAIGVALASKRAFHVVALRSNVPAGSTVDIVAKQIAEISGKTLGRDFGVCFNPAFLRNGKAVEDFCNPRKTVVGYSDPESRRVLEMIYSTLDDDIIFTSIETAEVFHQSDFAQ